MSTVTISVSSSNQLLNALLSAQGGEEILLEGGDYGHLSTWSKLGFDGAFDSMVTIKSADAGDPAVFDGMWLNQTGNLTIDGVTFNYEHEDSDPYYTAPFIIKSSENIVIKNSTFLGENIPKGGIEGADEFGTGRGLFIRDSVGVTVEGSEFSNWLRGMLVMNSDEVSVVNNDFHDIRSDGMDFVQVNDLLIEGNYLHDFAGDYEIGDHRDMIQFWTSGATDKSSNIIIRDNLLDLGEGSYTQSIFMRNEQVDSQGAGREMFYENILIENNTIYNGHLHGITVGETDGLVIKNNSLIAVKDTVNPDPLVGRVSVPAININSASNNVTVENNLTSGISGYDGQSDWVLTNNLKIQNYNVNSDGYYQDLFINSSTDLGQDGHHFVAKPGGIIDLLEIGSNRTRDMNSFQDGEAIFEIADNGDNVHTFDASVMSLLLDQDEINDAEFIWSFGDGEFAKGEVISHEFDHAGYHDVTLFTQVGDTIYRADREVAIRGGKALSFNSEDGNFVSHGYGEDSNLGAVAAFQDGAIQLGGGGTVASVGRGNLGAIRGSDELALDFTISGDSSGEVFRFHMSFQAMVSDNGELGILVLNDEGNREYVATRGQSILDGQDHDISLRLADNMLNLFIDGEHADSRSFEGTLPDAGSWDLMFGNPWGRKNFSGEISSFDISAGEILPNLPVINTLPDPDTGNLFDIIDTPANDPIDLDEILIGDSWSYFDDGQAPLVIDNETVSVGRLAQYHDSQKLGFAITFNSDQLTTDYSRLVWNHMKLGLTLNSGEIKVEAATADNGFKAFTTKNLNLSNGEDHTAIVLLDSEEDHLQVLVDDEVVIDRRDVDFDHVGARGYEWGWHLGTPWGHRYTGEVSEWKITDDFDFYEPPALADSLVPLDM